MNLDKLLALLDRHRERSTAYRHLADRYRQATKEVARLQAELAGVDSDTAEAFVLRSADTLATATPDALVAAGITEGQARRLASAKRLAERLRLEVAGAAETVKQSQALADNLIEHARQRGESVAL